MSDEDVDEAYWEDEGDETIDWKGDEGDSMQNYEKLNLEWPGGPRIAPVRFYVDGVLDGDIKWNNIDALIKIEIPYSVNSLLKFPSSTASKIDHYFSCKIRPFTHNCGAKTIEDVDTPGTREEKELFLTYVESFLWHQCNVGILLGSDCVDEGGLGVTAKNVLKFGKGYTQLPEVWNPNYTWNENHKIFLFYKNLGDYVHVDYWR